MNATRDTTIRTIVADDFRAAAVFESFHLDFCCGGGLTLDEACRDKQLDADVVLAAVAKACVAEDPLAPRFADWPAATLVNYIVDKHHSYVRDALPAIKAHTEKVARVHGERHPEMIEVDRLFGAVVAEMTSHMFKEEHVLFPYIAQLEDAVSDGRRAPGSCFGSVENPIRMMEAEHDSAGGAMARMREITNGFAPPADACTTFRVCLQELDAFERDLHTHVHLENNILFPAARRLEAAV
jgi:regulator of cell morphogenesis and NO signaling